MGRLVQRLIDQHRPQAVDRRRRIALRLEPGQLDSQGEAKLVDSVSAGGSPLLVAVLGQQLALVRVERRPVGGRIAPSARPGPGLLESLDIDPDRRLGAELDQVVVQLDAGRAVKADRVEGAPRRKDRLVQVVAGRGLVAIRPEQLCGLPRVHPPFGREREQLDQGLGLAQPPSVVGNHLATQSDRERPKKADAQHLIAHPNPLLAGAIAFSKYSDPGSKVQHPIAYPRRNVRGLIMAVFPAARAKRPADKCESADPCSG